jgi:hypothetical protein
MVALFLVVYNHASLTSPAVHFEPGHFAIAPYLQLGESGKLEDVEVCWGSTENKTKWTLETQSHPAVSWAPAGKVLSERVSVENVEPFTFYHAPIHAIIPPGAKWSYRILQDGKPIFDAEAIPLHSGLQNWRFAVIGDTAAGSIGQKAVASALYNACKPDMLLIAGDIVYQNGRLSEYFRRFFPIFNADKPGRDGVPLMRSTLFVAAPGNHDTARGAFSEGSNLDLYPDGLAYYEVWRQPLNGPVEAKPGVNSPNVRGSATHVDCFKRAAGNTFPRMGNFSYDYANAHFVVLDANLYMNWQDGKLRAWLEQDLQKAQLAKWRFVMFHQPPFNADLHHGDEQQMRLVADIFQRYKVDVVFAGHVHNYQRTRPLTFNLARHADGGLIGSDHHVDGDINMDMSFDGTKDQTPDGIIYVVTGCGGATLVEAEVPRNNPSAPKFAVTMLPLYSYTQCDVSGDRLVVQQMDPGGKVLDRFEVTKSAVAK